MGVARVVNCDGLYKLAYFGTSLVKLYTNLATATRFVGSRVEMMMIMARVAGIKL